MNTPKTYKAYKAFETALLITSIIILTMLTGCSALEEKTKFHSEFFAMDTFMSIEAKGGDAEEAIKKSEEYIQQLESLISRTDENSEIYELNHSEGEIITVSHMTYDIISIALSCAVKTEGGFDPTVCAITDLWGIGTEHQGIPTEEAIAEALESVSYENIILLGDNKVQLINGAQIDLGAVGKGYAADGIYQIFKENQVESGIIALGGNLYLVGENEEAMPWNVGIVDPDDTEAHRIGVKVTDKSVVTTGAYERFFEENGKRYHHIFDTQTGYPTNKDIKSVTIVSENSTLADIYATAIFAMGYEKAITFVESDIEAIIIREDNVVYVSEGLEGAVTLDDKYKH